MSNTITTTWCGWHRPRGGQWAKVCEAPSRDACWGRLLEATRTLEPGDSLTLPAGEVPKTRTFQRRCF
jgi:hypothetical protein